MMSSIPLALEHPLILLVGVLLTPLPWLLQPRQASLSPYLATLPDDPLSALINKGLRLLGSISILALSTALAGLHLPGGQVERIAQGAHLALVIDRSSSMNEPFDTSENKDLSKAQAAKQLLRNFADQRDKDQIGVVAFSTTPMPILPLTSQTEAIHAAINAIDHPGLSHTDIGRALL